MQKVGYWQPLEEATMPVPPEANTLCTGSRGVCGLCTSGANHRSSLRTKSSNTECLNARTEIASFVHYHHEAPARSRAGRHASGESPRVHCLRRRIYWRSASRGGLATGRLRPVVSSSRQILSQDVRLILRTDDGALILMTYRGIRYASPEVSDRIARGERVVRSDYYLRTAPFFETSSPKYSWLNKIVSVGIGERQPDGVTYELFEIL